MIMCEGAKDVKGGCKGRRSRREDEGQKTKEEDEGMKTNKGRKKQGRNEGVLFLYMKIECMHKNVTESRIARKHNYVPRGKLAQKEA